MANNGSVSVEVLYATPETVWRRQLTLRAGSTALQAIEASGFQAACPEYPYGQLTLGVFGQACEFDRVLADQDRVEVYRALVFDPMESRRRRAVHRQAFMTKPKNRPRRRKAKLAALAKEAATQENAALENTAIDSGAIENAVKESKAD